MTQRTAERPTGAVVLDAVRRGELPPPAAADLLDLTLEVVGEGHTRFGFQAHARFDNGFGAMHGGLLATVADFAAVTSLRTLLSAEVAIVTTNLNMTFIRPVTEATGVLHCDGRATHVGRSLGVAEAVITDEQGRIHAQATATCHIGRVPAS